MSKVEHILAVCSGKDIYCKTFDKEFFENCAVGQNVYLDMLTKKPFKIFSIARILTGLDNNALVVYYANTTDQDLNRSVLFVLGFKESNQNKHLMK